MAVEADRVGYVDTRDLRSALIDAFGLTSQGYKA